MIKKDITDKEFYTTPPWYLRKLGIYVKGDIIHIIPLLLVIILTGIFDWRFMLILVGLYIGFRGIGEMVYWLLQQFGDKKYRPKTKHANLTNNAVYIIYQTASLKNILFGFGIVIFVMLYLY